jgi:hypothetical protein
MTRDERRTALHGDNAEFGVRLAVSTYVACVGVAPTAALGMMFLDLVGPQGSAHDLWVSLALAPAAGLLLAPVLFSIGIRERRWWLVGLVLTGTALSVVPLGFMAILLSSNFPP